MGFPIYILFLIHVFLCVHGIGVESGGQRQRCGSSWAWSSEIQPEGLTVDAGSFSCPCFASMGLQMYPTTAGFLCGCWGPLYQLSTPQPLFHHLLEHESDGTERWEHQPLHTSSGILPLITQESMRARQMADMGVEPWSAGAMGTCIYLGFINLGFLTYKMEILSLTWWDTTLISIPGRQRQVDLCLRLACSAW